MAAEQAMTHPEDISEAWHSMPEQQERLLMSVIQLMVSLQARFIYMS